MMDLPNGSIVMANDNPLMAPEVWGDLPVSASKSSLDDAWGDLPAPAPKPSLDDLWNSEPAPSSTLQRRTGRDARTKNGQDELDAAWPWSNSQKLGSKHYEDDDAFTGGPPPS